MLQVWTPHKFDNHTTAARQLLASNNLTIAYLELLCDTRTNCFVVNYTNWLHDLIPSYDNMGVTGGSNTIIHFKGTLHACLYCEETPMIIEIKDDPCMK